MPLITDSVGRVLGKRYRLVSALGTGASAHVFLAEDVSLQRHVAVKVLQPALARDEAFLRRFRAEARSVASLNHPHVLRVFDWGEDHDGPYLVLEYLGGGSLRDLLDRRVRLTHAQAARLGAEVADGLAYAHARGLVHRDVKPANLLFDEEGRVRVADFGVARALAEAAWTEPAGAMVGTARYASPEQAEGHPVDGRCDVYALALVLYEGLTGTVPFVTDTTVGTLMARVGATLPAHPDLGPLLPVLTAAAHPEVGRRLDAAGFSRELRALGPALPPPRRLPVGRGAPVDDATAAVAAVRPGGGAGYPDDTLAVPVSAPGPGTGHPDDTVAVPATGAAPIKAGPGEVFDAEALGLAATGLDLRPARSAEPAFPTTGTLAPAGAEAAPPTVARRRRRSRWPWVVAAVVLALAVAAAAVVAVREKVFTPSRPVPAVTGVTVAAARAAALHQHLLFSVAPAVQSITVPAGDVVSQQPAARTVVKEGTTVRVVPSAGPPSVPVPSLSGVDCATAQRLLSEAHLAGSCPPSAAVYNGKVPSGQVVSWSFQGAADPTHAPYGSTIAMVVSKGPPPVTVPSLTGSSSSYQTAQAALQQLGLGATETQQTSTTVPAGQVIGSSPAAGAEAPAGSTVTVVVSSGPPMVTVPNVDGMSVTQAQAALQQAGLTVGEVYGPSGGTVFDTSPAIGQSVVEGSPVNLYTM